MIHGIVTIRSARCGISGKRRETAMTLVRPPSGSRPAASEERSGGEVVIARGTCDSAARVSGAAASGTTATEKRV